MATTTRFLKGEFGIQTAFETPATPTHILPFVGEYTDTGDFHEAEMDTGRWIPQTLLQRVSQHATMRFTGAATFEILPVILSGGFTELTPTGAGPYSYDHELDLSTPGSPAAFTFRFGAVGENIGATGPAIQIADAYCSRIRLQGNSNDRSVTMESEWFGASVNDNSGAGFAFAASALPTNLSLLRFPFATLEYEDATTTGSVFTTMTALDCMILDWELDITTGLAPKWSADANALTYCGVRIDTPLIEFRPTIRTEQSTYQNLYRKGNDNSPTYQEVQFTLTGESSRQVIWQMTGRWQPFERAHSRVNNEVVMQGVFRAQGYPAQTTTPHAFGWNLDTQWEWNA